MGRRIDLKVINGIKKEKPDYYTLYSTAFTKVLEIAVEKYESHFEFDKDTIKKLVFLGVKMIVYSEFQSNKNKDTLLREFSLISFIDDLISLLTPREFQNIFPIEKVYYDENDGLKDYFYTLKYIKNFGMDKVIGDEIDDFLWEYMNWTINIYMVEKLGVISDIRRLETGKGLWEEFLEEHNIPSYTLYEEEGKQYVVNNQTSEVSEVKKPKPRYLKVIK